MMVDALAMLMANMMTRWIARASTNHIASWVQINMIVDAPTRVMATVATTTTALKIIARACGQ